MPNTKIKNEDHVIERLMRRLAAEPPMTQEEIAKINAEWAAMEPSTYESAFMDKNREISIKIVQHLKDGTVTDGWETLKPGEEGYEETVQRHGMLKPGKGNTIIQRLVDDKWVDADTMTFSL